MPQISEETWSVIGLHQHLRVKWNSSMWRDLETRKWADDHWALVALKGGVVLGVFREKAQADAAFTTLRILS
jgi:hypothetical protein